MNEPRHRPVLTAEVLTWLDPQPDQIIVDCTVGAGGHARHIAERIGPGGRLIALDRDPAMLAIARDQVNGCETDFVHSNFDRLLEVLAELGVAKVDGVLADLGFASDQLEDPKRGLSIMRDAPLDMRYDLSSGQTARDIIARWSEQDLADIFWRFGEERRSRRIAHRIVTTRQCQPIETTRQLAELVRRCVGGRHGRIHPATRVFQALRIAVNDELGCLDRLLRSLPQALRLGGRAVIISFHSLEDRMVKQAFRQKDIWEALTPKPITASPEEVKQNPRSRSAKLRAAKLIGVPPTATA